MSVEEHKKDAPKNVTIIVVTVSDTRTKETDESGKIIVDLLKNSGHEIIDHIIMENNESVLKTFIEHELVWYRAQVILFNGGTGISSRDITVETVEKLMDKKLDGFGEIFRYLSYKEIGTAALMSRTMACVCGSTIVICLPGSPKAVKLAMEQLVLREIGHMVGEVTK